MEEEAGWWMVPDSTPKVALARAPYIGQRVDLALLPRTEERLSLLLR
jgi:hypothetical protein